MTPDLDPSPLEANQRHVAAATAGICRNMQLPDVIGVRGAVVTPLGGGDLNGMAALVFHYQAGTAGDRLGSPRKPTNPGNYCGVV